MTKQNLFDKYSHWLRNASRAEDVEDVMECVNDDKELGCLSTEQFLQLKELAENISAALLAGEVG